MKLHNPILALAAAAAAACALLQPPVAAAADARTAPAAREALPDSIEGAGRAHIDAATGRVRVHAARPLAPETRKAQETRAVQTRLARGGIVGVEAPHVGVHHVTARLNADGSISLACGDPSHDHGAAAQGAAR